MDLFEKPVEDLRKKQDRFSNVLHLQAKETMNLNKRKAARYSWYSQIGEAIQKELKIANEEGREEVELEEGQIQPMTLISDGESDDN